jgi:hypothetical protein
MIIPVIDCIEWTFHVVCCFSLEDRTRWTRPGMGKVEVSVRLLGGLSWCYWEIGPE